MFSAENDLVESEVCFRSNRTDFRPNRKNIKNVSENLERKFSDFFLEAILQYFSYIHTFDMNKQQKKSIPCKVSIQVGKFPRMITNLTSRNMLKFMVTTLKTRNKTQMKITEIQLPKLFKINKENYH